MEPGKAAEAVSEKRSHFLRLGSHGDREKAGTLVLCRTGFDCHSQYHHGTCAESVLEKQQEHTVVFSWSYVCIVIKSNSTEVHLKMLLIVNIVNIVTLLTLLTFIC